MRQNSGIRVSTARASTLTGQPRLAVDRPAACAARHSVGTRMRGAYQNQRFANGATWIELQVAVMSCSAGAMPVMKVVRLG